MTKQDFENFKRGTLTETNQIVLSDYSTQSFSKRVLSPSHLPTSLRLELDSLSSILTRRIFPKLSTSPTNSAKMSVEFFEEILLPPFSIKDIEISEIIDKQILLLRDRLKLIN